MIKFGEVRIGEVAKKHIKECVDRNYVTMGPKTKELEDKWAKKFGYLRVVATNSGTSACMAALIALYGIRNANPGDEVIVPALSFIATANAVRAAGFVPVFCDIKVETLGIDETKIEELVTKRTIAIMPVTLMGKPPKLDVIRDIANKHNLSLIIDNCEGHGCKYQGKYMSEWGDMVCYSAYAAHILFAGEFGFVGCKDEEHAFFVESARSHGRAPGSLYFNHPIYGLNLKPTDLHASIGLGSFEEFDFTMEKRTKNLKELRSNMQQYSNLFYFVEEDEGDTNSPHAFSFVIKPNSIASIQGLKGAFTGAQIEWKRNFGSMPDHGCFHYMKQYRQYPHAVYAGDKGIHIGVHQYLTQYNIDEIVDTVNRYVRSL